MSTAVNKSAHPFDKAKFETLLNRRFFYAPAFEIYGGVAGLYDYGPSGSALQANIISEWRKHFVVHDGMFELDTTILTPVAVLETSGHVAQFTDWVVKDAKSGAVLRAKDLIKEVLETRLADPVNCREGFPFNKAFLKLGGKDGSADTARGLDDSMAQEYEGVLRELDSYGEQELADILKKHRIRNPDTDNAVGSPEPFDLMFKTSIGSTGQQRVYLRPETAQGQFLHFNRLLELNNGRLPFASALVGRVFHNEISPRGGLLRVREFTAAEIEHYMDPDDKSHPGFMEVKNVQIAVLDRHMQEVGLQEATRPSVGEAVCSGLVANEALGYFMARIWQFLVNIGIDSDRLRFRQRMGSNTAHYAVDNWDVEIHNSVTGWILCGGCADRAAYDLDLHSAKTGTPLVARQALKDAIVTEKETVTWNRRLLGKTYREDAIILQKSVEAMDESQLVKLKGDLTRGSVTVKTEDGKEFTLTSELVSIVRRTRKQSIRQFTPHVLESALGFGRILYCLLEHSFSCRKQDIQRGVLSLPPIVAPTKVFIVPLSAREDFDPLVEEIASKMRKSGVVSYVDDSSASIGKRYARNDELGTPFGITVDFASIQNRTVTLRERDTMGQRIGNVDLVAAMVAELANGTVDWEEACRRLPKYEGVQAVE